MLPFLKDKIQLTEQEAGQQQGITITLQELIHSRVVAKVIQWPVRRKAKSHHLGDKASNMRGRGMDFEEVRLYQPGDDVRLINWSLTAKSGKVYTKIYCEEKQRPVYVIVDQSTSMKFGTRVMFKSVMAAKIASIFAWAALNQQDQVGGIVFNGEKFEEVQPARNRQALLHLLSKIVDYNTDTASEQKNHLPDVLSYLNKRKPTGALIIILSDFYGDFHQLKNSMRYLSISNEVVNVMLYDPIEQHLPEMGVYAFSDGVSRCEVNASDQQQREAYEKPFVERYQAIEKLSHQYNMSFLSMATDEDVIQLLGRRVVSYAK